MSGQRHVQKILGWVLLIQWKNGTGLWIPSKDLKESNPVEVAEFASSWGIET